MFSSFSDVCFAVKSSQRKMFVFLTEKSFSKFGITVYGKNFRKPFSKTRVPLLSLSALFLCSLLSALFSLSPNCCPTTSISSLLTSVSNAIARGSFARISNLRRRHLNALRSGGIFADLSLSPDVAHHGGLGFADLPLR